MSETYRPSPSQQERNNKPDVVEASRPSVSNEFLTHAISNPTLSQVDKLIENMHMYQEERAITPNTLKKENAIVSKEVPISLSEENNEVFPNEPLKNVMNRLEGQIYKSVDNKKNNEQPSENSEKDWVDFFHRIEKRKTKIKPPPIDERYTVDETADHPEGEVLQETIRLKFRQTPEGFWFSPENERYSLKIEGEELVIKLGKEVVQVPVNHTQRGEFTNTLINIDLKDELANLNLEDEYGKVMEVLDEAGMYLEDFGEAIPARFTEEEIKQMEEEDSSVMAELTKKPEHSPWKLDNSAIGEIVEIKNENGEVVNLRDKLRILRVAGSNLINIINTDPDHAEVYEVDGTTVKVDDSILLTGKVSMTFIGNVQFDENISKNKRKISLAVTESDNLEPEFRLEGGRLAGAIEVNGGKVVVQDGSMIENGIVARSKAEIHIDRSSLIKPQREQTLFAEGLETKVVISDSVLSGEIHITDGASAHIQGETVIEGDKSILVGDQFRQKFRMLEHADVSIRELNYSQDGSQNSLPQIKVPIFIHNEGSLTISQKCLNKNVLQHRINIDTANYSDDYSCLHIIENNKEYEYRLSDFRDQSVFNNGDELRRWHEEQKIRGKQPYR